MTGYQQFTKCDEMVIFFDYEDNSNSEDKV
jgi:hypothetical protein